MGEEAWLEKLDAATAGVTTAVGDVPLSLLDERVGSGRLPLAPVDVRFRQRPREGDVEPAQESEPEPEQDAVAGRFDRLEALVLELTHRVDRAGAEQTPQPDIEALQTIEVGVRAAARVMLRCTDEITAALASAPEPAQVDLSGFEQGVHELAGRIDRLASAAPPVADVAAFESSVAAIVACSTASNPTTDAVDRLVTIIERLEHRLEALEQRLDCIAEADAAVKSQLAQALRLLGT